jgi:uncharacterized membrane protein
MPDDSRTRHDDYRDNRRNDRRRGHPNGADLLVFILGGLVTGAIAYAVLSPRSDRDGISHRPPDDAPGRAASRSRFGRHAVTGRTVTIDRPRREVYEFWRDFRNLEGVMANVRNIEVHGDLTRWTIRGPLGADVHVETRVVNDRPGEQIAWRSTEGSDIVTEGKVMFRDAPGNRGTEVEAIIAYVPPGGHVGQLIAKLFQAEPAIQGRRDLKRLKMLLETGEIATSDNRRTD